MLTSLALHDFKSFADAEIPFAPLTLLVGANASGKSNILDALRVVRGLASGLGVAEALEGRMGVWTGVRGGAAEASRHGAESFALATKWAVRAWPADAQERSMIKLAPEVVHRLAVTCAPQLAITSDAFGTADWEWQAYGWGGDSLDFGRSVLGPGLALRADERVLFAAALRTAASGLVPFEPQPDALRGAHAIASTTIGEHGEGVTALLHRLVAAEPSRRADLLDWLSELCAPKIVDLDFVEVKDTREVILVLVEEGGRRVTSRNASDGTLRFLALLAAVWLSPSGTVLTLEEPDIGLHPTRLRLLAELFESRRGDVQVIATTHSPTLLANLSDGALADVIAFGRDSESGLSIAARVGGLKHFSALAESRDVAHLFATGWLEQAL